MTTLLRLASPFALAAVVAASIGLARPSQPAAAGSKPANPETKQPAPGKPVVDPLKTVAAFSPFEGEWAIDAAWEDGKPLKAREMCTWILGGKHLKYQTFLPTAAGEAQRYEGVFTWHPELHALVCYSFDVDGGVSEYRVETADAKVFKIGFSALHPGGKEPNLRQTIEFTGPDTYRWTAELRSGEQWKRLINADWKRVKGK